MVNKFGAFRKKRPSHPASLRLQYVTKNNKEIGTALCRSGLPPITSYAPHGAVSWGSKVVFVMLARTFW